MSELLKKTINKKISRRSFLKASAAVGGAATVSGLLSAQTGLAASYGQNSPDKFNNVKYRRSACFGCAFFCGNQARIESVNGVETATKLDGNPYDILTNDIVGIGTAEVAPSGIADPHKNPGRLCAKGQAQLKELYDPYRVLTPLKRTGKRGEGKWTAISWGTAIDEIVGGGWLPGHSGGAYNFKGLDDIRGDGSAMTSSDPDIHPDFQPGNPTLNGNPTLIWNQGKGMKTLWIDGRNQQGEFSAGDAQARFGDAAGVQRHYHDSICNGSWKASWEQMLGGTYKFRPDYTGGLGITYAIFAGCNPMEADQALNLSGRKLTERLAASDFEGLVVLDPRLSVTASAANKKGGNSKWLRIKQGGDGAFALGMVKRWFDPNDDGSSTADNYFANRSVPKADGVGTYNVSDYLIRPNVNGAYLNFSNASYLVKVESGYPYGKIPTTARVIDSVSNLVGNASVVSTAKLDPSPGELTTAGTTDGVTYLGTVYQLLRNRMTGEAPGPHTSANCLKWADIVTATGLTQAEIEGVADKFWDAKRPAALCYRGVFATSQGYYAAQAFGMLDILRDRVDRPGGLVYFNSYGYAVAAVGTAGTPAGAKSQLYAGTYFGQDAMQTFLKNNPPRRAWWYAFKMPEQEVLPRESIGYPWRVRANIFYVSNHAYNTHTGKYDACDALRKADVNDGNPNYDPNAYYVPLNISITTTLNETAELCDYILPDTTWAERWSSATATTYGGVPVYRGTVRRPIVGSYNAITVAEESGSDPRTAYWYKGAFSGVNTVGAKNGALALANALSGPQTSEDILILLGRRWREIRGTADNHFYRFGLNGMGSGIHFDSSYDLYQAMLGGLGKTSGTATVINGSLTTTNKADLYNILNDLNADDGTNPAVATAWGTSNPRYYLWMGGRRQNADPDYKPSGYNPNLYKSTGLYMSGVYSGTYKKIWIPGYEGKALYAQKADGTLYERYFDQLPPVTKDSYSSGLDISKTVLSNQGVDINQGDLAAGYTYTITTNKMAWNTQSRGGSNEWLKELQESNFVNMPKAGNDGKDYAIASDGSTKIYTGDTIKVEANYSDSNGDPASQTGIANVTDVLAAGQIHVEHHFGRWATGAKGFKVDGKDSTNGLTTAAAYDSQGNFIGGTRGANYDGKLDLGAGVGVSAIGRREPYHEGKGGGGLTDIAGGHGMYGSRVKITRLS